MPLWFKSLLPELLCPRVAASTASIAAPRRPARSSACSPAMVVPPGLATASFSAPGCWPVSRTIFALPSTVCAASASATSRGKPHLTPPSASASMKTYTNAGPLPERPVTASSSGSATRNAFPTAPKSFPTSSTSSGVAVEPGRISRCARPDEAGRVRHDADEPVFSPSPCASVWSVTPAAIETTR